MFIIGLKWHKSLNQWLTQWISLLLKQKLIQKQEETLENLYLKPNHTNNPNTYYRYVQ